jgi:hypothetical protein
MKTLQIKTWTIDKQILFETERPANGIPQIAYSVRPFGGLAAQPNLDVVCCFCNTSCPNLLSFGCSQHLHPLCREPLFWTTAMEAASFLNLVIGPVWAIVIHFVSARVQLFSSPAPVCGEDPACSSGLRC